MVQRNVPLPLAGMAGSSVYENVKAWTLKLRPTISRSPRRSRSSLHPRSPTHGGGQRNDDDGRPQYAPRTQATLRASRSVLDAKQGSSGSDPSLQQGPCHRPARSRLGNSLSAMASQTCRLEVAEPPISTVYCNSGEMSRFVPKSDQWW